MEHSPLATLSPEIRNRIYVFALYERRPVAISKNFPAEAALLRTCKQIRQEAELLFYALNDFAAIIHFRWNHSDHHEADVFFRWLQSGPPSKLKFIRSLTVQYEDPGRNLDATPANQVPNRATLNWNLELMSKRPFFKRLQECSFGDRRIEQVVKFVCNGAHDSLLASEILELWDQSRRMAHLFASALLMWVASGLILLEISGIDRIDLIDEILWQIQMSRAGVDPNLRGNASE